MHSQPPIARTVGPDPDWFISDLDPPRTDHPHTFADALDAIIARCRSGEADLDAVIYERGPGTYRLRRITEVEEYAAAVRPDPTEADRRRRRLREFDAFDTDPVPGRTLRAEFVPYYTHSQQMYLASMLEAHAKCFRAYSHDPIARRLVQLKVQFILSDPPSIEIEDQRLQQVWEAYERRHQLWRPPANRIRQWATDLSIFGELFIYRREDRSLRTLPPDAVWEIVTDPADLETVFFYWLNLISPYIIRTAPGLPAQRYIVRDIPAEMVYHVKVNTTAHERRGRSDLFPALSFLRQLRTYIANRVARSQAESAYVWDVKVAGSPADVAAIAASDVKDPHPGSTFFHSPAVERTVIAPQLARAGLTDSTIDSLMAMIANAMGVPLEYLSSATSAGRGTRATALVASEPVVKALRERQAIIEEVIRQLMRWAFEEIGLTRDRASEAVDASSITFPSLYEEDQQKRLDLLMAAQQNQWISRRRAAMMAASELAITQYDYEREQAEIAGEEQERAQMITPAWAMPENGDRPPARGEELSGEELAAMKGRYRGRP